MRWWLQVSKQPGIDRLNFTGTPDNFAQDIDLLREAARGAGDRAMAMRGGLLNEIAKKDGSPVCDADMLVNQFLSEFLLKFRPDYGYLTEEMPDHHLRDRPQRSFIVDPIDGTYAYLRGRDDFCISLAVVCDGEVETANVYRPATQELFSAANGRGSFRNGKRLRLEPVGTKSSNPDMAIGLRTQPENLQKRLPSILQGCQFHPICSLALRLVSIATGQTDMTFKIEQVYDWDLAAASLILSEAGGKIMTLNDKKLDFDHKYPVNPSMLAFRPGLEPLIEETLNQMPKKWRAGDR